MRKMIPIFAPCLKRILTLGITFVLTAASVADAAAAAAAVTPALETTAAIAGVSAYGSAPAPALLPPSVPAAVPVPNNPPTASAPPAPSIAAAASGTPASGPTAACLSTGDGFIHAKIGGAIERQIDWPNGGTVCQGEARQHPPGVRLSFHRANGEAPNLLLVFGLTGVSEGQPAREVKTNLTIIVQGTNRIYGTLGDARCTVDSLQQRPTAVTGTYRLEARGFCTQPAHAVRGKGDVLVSTFEFAGPVTYDSESKSTKAEAHADQ